MEIYTREHWQAMMDEINRSQKFSYTAEDIETRLKELRAKFDLLVDKIQFKDEVTLRAIGELSTQISLTRHLLLVIAKEGFHPYAHLQ